LSIAPPQRWVLEKPKNDVRRTDTCQGHRPNGASLPPTILVSGRGNRGGTPHCMFLPSSAAAIVITEPVFSFASMPTVDVSDVTMTLTVLGLVALFTAVIAAVVAIIGLVVPPMVDVTDVVVLGIVVFFVGRGLVEVSK